MTVTFIRWKDAWTQEAAESGTPAPPLKLIEMQEVGFLIAESDEAVSIAMEIEAGSPGRWRLHIPKVNIVERRDMEVDRAFPVRKRSKKGDGSSKVKSEHGESKGRDSCG